MSTIPLSRRHRMLLMAAAAAGVVVAPFGLRTAAACSPVVMPGYGSFIANTPIDGATDVPINGAVILDVETLVGEPQKTTVSVSETDTGIPVAGGFNSYFWDRAFLVWLPAQPLRPGTRYRVDAAIVSEIPRPAKATGAAEMSFAFITGSGPVPPIALQGQMQVRIETYQRDREDWRRCYAMSACTSSCGCDTSKCAPTIVHEQASRARVTLPVVSGGLTDPGYVALVRVTADSPYQFPTGPDTTATGVLATGSTLALQENAASEMLFDLDQGQQGAAYRPCFALRVTDFVDNVRDGDPVCLAETVQPVRNLDQGCRVAGAGGNEGVWSCLGSLALLLLGARRRHARGG